MISLCSDAGAKPVERRKGVDEETRMVSRVKIPAWSGTRPHVRKTIQVLAQKTAQCLDQDQYTMLIMRTWVKGMLELTYS
jgi:hypothetical protein